MQGTVGNILLSQILIGTSDTLSTAIAEFEFHHLSYAIIVRQFSHFHKYNIFNISFIIILYFLYLSED